MAKFVIGIYSVIAHTRLLINLCLHIILWQGCHDHIKKNSFCVIDELQHCVPLDQHHINTIDAPHVQATNYRADVIYWQQTPTTQQQTWVQRLSLALGSHVEAKISWAFHFPLGRHEQAWNALTAFMKSQKRSMRQSSQIGQPDPCPLASQDCKSGTCWYRTDAFTQFAPKVHAL